MAPGHHVHAGGHHGGGVDQGADRGGAFHGIGQPGIEGDLGRFAGGPHEEQQGDQGDRPLPQGEFFRGGGKDGFEVDGSESHKDQKDRQQKPVVPDAVDDEGLFAGVGGRFFLIPEADQEIRAEPHPFPPDEKEEKVVGGDENQHEENEKIQIGEITGIVGIVVHIPMGIDVDDEGNPRNHHHHHDGKGIDQETHLRLKLAGKDPGVKNFFHRTVCRGEVQEIDEHEERNEER